MSKFIEKLTEKLNFILNEPIEQRFIRKATTDLRKLAAIEDLILFLSQLISEQDSIDNKIRLLDSISVLQCFFIKNAPIGFNRPQDFSQHYFDAGLERELSPYQTTGKYIPDNHKAYSDYFRAVASHMHRRRLLWEKMLQKQLPGSNTKKTYVSFDIVPIIEIYDDEQMIVDQGEDVGQSIVEYAGIKVADSVINSQSLSGGDGILKRWSTRIVGNKQLVLWNNEKSAGHQSTFNKAGLSLNLIQHSYVMCRLQENDEYKPHGMVYYHTQGNASSPRPNIYLEHKHWADIILYTTEIGEPINYKEQMLVSKRELITQLNKKISTNNITLNLTITRDIPYPYSFNYECSIRAVTTPEGYQTYPCLVLEPYFTKEQNNKNKQQLENLRSRVTNEEINSLIKEMEGELVTSVKNKFISNWNTPIDIKSKISLSNRASFGFLNPSIGDVGIAVRIWPGLMDNELTKYNIAQMLGINLNINLPNEGIVSRAISAQAIVRLIHNDNIRQILLEGIDVPISNLPGNCPEEIKRSIKRNTLKALGLCQINYDNISQIRLLSTHLHRCVENLSEYNIVLHAINFDQQYQDDTLNDVLAKAATSGILSFGESFPSWTHLKSIITNSGMAAYRTCLTTINEVPELDPWRLYYESEKLTRNMEKILKPKNRYYVTALDIAYNFTSQNDVNSDEDNERALNGWNQAPAQPWIGIYDATNVLNSEIFHNVKNRLSRMDERNLPIYIFIFESLSKHFQFGADKTTLGRLSVFRVGDISDESLEKSVSKLEHCVLPVSYKKYLIDQIKNYYL